MEIIEFEAEDIITTSGTGDAPVAPAEPGLMASIGNTQVYDA